MTNAPDIAIKLMPGSSWEAIYLRNPRFRGYGNSPTEAVGNLVTEHPALFMVNRIHFNDDAATQTHISSNGIDREISKTYGNWF